ncbi:hypothetical protein Glove_80g43 [Diversispora epigaea]|uniref:Pentacotripeptide-repeat region of PRORP domain-containing protein n=1 Tax=Diversispora epigaea TaxID=1348612 RepID=A0A397JEX0_9GLOM|nr:hypothetical protein Glove_80g43 [Diversispora epigaea]
MLRQKQFIHTFCSTVEFFNVKQILGKRGFVSQCHNNININKINYHININNEGVNFLATSNKIINKIICAKPKYTAFQRHFSTVNNINDINNVNSNKTRDNIDSSSKISDPQPENRVGNHPKENIEKLRHDENTNEIHSINAKLFLSMVKEGRVDEAEQFLKEKELFRNFNEAIKFKYYLNDSRLQIENYVKADQIIFKYLKTKGMKPQEISNYNNLTIEYYLGIDNIEEIHKFYESETNLSPRNGLYIVAAFNRNNNLEMVKQVLNKFNFNEIEMAEYNNLRYYLNPEDFEQLLEILRHHPNNGIFTSHVVNLFRRDQIKLVMLLYNEIIVNEEIKVNENFYGVFITGFLNKNLFTEANHVWKVMKKREFKPSNKLYGQMVHGFAKKKTYYDAEVIWNNMRKDNIKPDELSYAAMIESYFRSKENQKAYDLFKQMNEDGIIITNIVYNRMINGLLLNRKVDDAMKLYKMMIKKGIMPDIITYNTLIRGLFSAQNYQLTCDILKDMKESKVMPDGTTLKILLERFFTKNDKGGIQKIINMFPELEIKPDEKTYGIIIDGLIKNNDLEEAHYAIEEMKNRDIKKNIQISTSLIQFNFKKKDFNSVQNLHNEIIDSGQKPTTGYFNVLIGGFINEGYETQAINYYKEMLSFNIHANETTYRTLINGYIKMNNLDKASEIVKEMNKVNYIPTTQELKKLIETLEKMRKKTKKNLQLE